MEHASHTIVKSSLPTQRARIKASELTLKLVRAGETFDTVTAAEGELLSVEFAYVPGDAPRSFGPPDTWDDGAPAEIHIRAIRTIVPLYFEEMGLKLEIVAGHDIKNLFSLEELEKVEEELLARAEAGALGD
jgi:hypothetical protein